MEHYASYHTHRPVIEPLTSRLHLIAGMASRSMTVMQRLCGGWLSVVEMVSSVVALRSGTQRVTALGKAMLFYRDVVSGPNYFLIVSICHCAHSTPLWECDGSKMLTPNLK